MKAEPYHYAWIALICLLTMAQPLAAQGIKSDSPANQVSALKEKLVSLRRKSLHDSANAAYYGFLLNALRRDDLPLLQAALYNPQSTYYPGHELYWLLHYACAENSPPTIRWLLDRWKTSYPPISHEEWAKSRQTDWLNKGAPPGANPLMVAIGAGRLPVVKLLLEGGFIKRKPAGCSVCYEDNKQAFLDEGLLVACARDRSDIAAYLLNQGANVNAVDNHYETPLWQATRHRSMRCWILLRSANARPTLDPQRKQTLMHAAALGDFAGVIPLLTTMGLSANAVTSQRETPLMMAAKRGYVATCRQLLLAGADPQVSDARGQTVLEMDSVRRWPEVITLLTRPERVFAAMTWAMLDTLVGTAQQQQRFISARIIGELALAKARLQVGERHATYGKTLRRLARTYQDVADFSRATQAGEALIAFVTKTQGTRTLPYLLALRQFADLQTQLARYEQADLLLTIGLDLAEKLFTTSHLEYARTLDALGRNAVQWGQTDRAKRLLTEALALKRRVAGEESLEYALSLIAYSPTQGVTYMMGDQKPVRIMEQAVALTARRAGDTTRLYRTHAEYLIGMYRSLNKQPYLTKADSLQRKIDAYLLSHPLPDDYRTVYWHPDMARQLTSRYDYLDGPGMSAHFDLAKHDYTQAKAIYARVYGKIHPAYVGVLSAMSNNLNLPDPSLRQEQTLLKILLGQKAIPIFSDGLYRRFQIDIDRYRDDWLNFGVVWAQRTPLAVSQLYNAVLRDKNRFLTSYLRFSKKKDFATFGPLFASFAQGMQSAKSLSPRDLFGLAIATADLSEGLEQGVDDLTRLFGIGQPAKPAIPEWKQVQQRLRPGEVAVEYFHTRTDSASPVVYYALLIRPDSQPPRLQFLFPETRLKQHLDSARAGQPGDTYRKLARGAEAESPAQAVNRVHAGALYDLCWKPIVPWLAPTDTVVYYAPSGLLHHLSFAAISQPGQGDKPGKRLAESYRLNCLTTTRQLLTPVAGLTLSDTTTAVLLGGVDYRPAPVSYLPQTLDEVRNIARALATKQVNYTLRTGEEASEAFIKKVGLSVNSPHIVHIATHGAFFATPAVTDDPNPLLRSLLYMAHIESPMKPGSPYANQDDGYLTALEISFLNLTDTRLVVLSACETGLGDIQGSEGVFGLQRAFKMAGADYILMSLWQVPDRETQEMMTLFYQNLVNNKPIEQAFSQAQAQLRQQYPADPQKWAGFVLIR